MSFRVFEGNVLSAEGWRMCNADECVWVRIPGANATIQVRSGIPATILPAFVARYNQLVEPVRDADTACWTLTNSVSTSNHPAGVAVDINWDSHPFHAYNTFGDRLPMLRQVQDEFRGCIQWGGDWGGNPQDEMHHELALPEGYLADPRDPNSFVLDVDQRLIDLANDLRAGYLGIYIPGTTPPPPPPSGAADVLARATGLTLGDAQTILPTVASGLQAAQCTNVNRIAMWLAQCGEESAGFSTTEEFASGAEYEGRCDDLGNCSPGDGVKYKGRTWIQITGRAHYREFSEWAFGKGLCASPTQFVDDPTSLGDLKWAGIGAAWYWTVSRPDINALSDDGDVVTVTHRINGGEHGLADRQSRYGRAHALGDQLLQLTTDTGEDDLSAEAERKIDEIHRELTQRLPSRSPLRHLGEGAVDTVAGFVLNTDGSVHLEIVKLLAGYGHPPTLALLREVAGADPNRYPDRQDDAKLAQAILADVSSTPAALAPVSALPQPQVVYLPAPTPAPVTEPLSNGTASTGQVIGQAYDALEALRLADALPIEGRAPLAALIAVLQTKNGSTV